MKIERYPLQMFEDTSTKEINSLFVPEGSQFLAAKILHDGIYVWYAVSELITELTKKESFVLMKPEQSIPENSTFITVLDTIVETPQGQAIMIFPLYKLNESA